MKNLVAFLSLIASSALMAASITLPNGQHVETDLVEVRLVAELTSGSNVPYILVAGRDCIQCDENTSLYIGELDHGRLAHGLSDKRNLYPGTLSDYESGEIVEKTRVFFGHCISPTNDQVIWFEEYLTDKGNWAKGEFLTTLDRNGLHNKLIANEQPDLQRVLSAARSRTCHEIPGIAGTTEP